MKDWRWSAMIAGSALSLVAGPGLGAETVPSPSEPVSADAAESFDTFETFEIPQPKQSTPPKPVQVATPDLQTLLPASSSDKPNRELHLTSTLSLTPWDQTLRLGANGTAGGRAFDSQLELNPRTGIPIVSSGYLSLQQRDATLRLGEGSDELYGGISGLRYAVKPKGGVGYGGGLYALSSGTDSRYLFGLDGQLPLGSLGNLGGLYGADGSWRLFSSRQSGSLSTYAHVGSLSKSGGADWSAYASARIAKGVNLSQRFTGRAGSRPYGADSTSLFMRLGPSMVTLDRWNSRDDSGSMAQHSASVMLPMGANQLSVRYQRLSTDFAGVHKQTETLWSAGLWHLGRNGRMIWGQGELAGSGGLGWRVGVSGPIAGNHQLSLEVGQRPNAALEVQRVRLALRLSADQEIGLNYGPSVGRRAEGRIGWGLDLTQRFSWAPDCAGTIVGKVEAQGGELPPGIQLVLDERVRVPVGPDGSFKIKKVPAGGHGLRIDVSKVPAQWGVAVASAEVQVVPKRSTAVAYRIQRLGRTTGALRSIRPLPRELAERKPFTGVALQLSNGQRTTTDDDGSYKFDNLPPGNYRIELPSDSVPADMIPVGPMTWDVRVDAGGVVTGADFSFDYKEKPIEIFEETAEVANLPES